MRYSHRSLSRLGRQVFSYESLLLLFLLYVLYRKQGVRCRPAGTSAGKSQVESDGVQGWPAYATFARSLTMEPGERKRPRGPASYGKWTQNAPDPGTRGVQP